MARGAGDTGTAPDRGRPFGERWRDGYREATEPVRDAFSGVRTRFEALPSVARWAVIGLVIVLAYALPGFLPYFTTRSLYWPNILTKIGIAALLALGLNVVVVFAVGAYSFAILSGAAKFAVVQYQVTSGALKGVNPVDYLPHWTMWFWLIFFAALAIALLAGVILGAPTLRLRGDYLAIVTLGFGEIVRITANNLDSIVNGPRGVQNIPNPQINIASFHYTFGTQNSLNDPFYWLLLTIIIIWIFFLRRLSVSRIGRAWAAIREDELAAAAVGVATVRLKLM